MIKSTFKPLFLLLFLLSSIYVFATEKEKITVSHIGRTLSMKKTNPITTSAITVTSKYKINWEDCTPLYTDKISMDSLIEAIHKKGLGNNPFIIYFTTALPPYAEMIPEKGEKMPPLTSIQKSIRKINISTFWSLNFDVEIYLQKFTSYIIFLPTEKHKLVSTLLVCMPNGEINKKLVKSQITSASLEKAMKDVIKRMPKDISNMFTNEINIEIESARALHKTLTQDAIERSKKK